MPREKPERESSSLKWWPAFVAGFCGPLIGWFLSRWLPVHFAMGIGCFFPWVLAGLIWSKWFPPRWGLPAWVAAILVGGAGGICVGLFYFLFP